MSCHYCHLDYIPSVSPHVFLIPARTPLPTDWFVFCSNSISGVAFQVRLLDIVDIAG